MAELPVGTLTFLLTDLQGSTRTWEAHPRAMRTAMVQHDAIVYGAVERSAGTMVESGREGDSVLAVFARPRDAAACALEIQRAFRSTGWPDDLRLAIRIALHTGEVELRGGHYFGPPLNRCARSLALCHPGQTVVTLATRELLAEDGPPGVELTDLGIHQLKDLKRSEHLFQLTDLDRPEQFPPVQARREYKSNLRALLTSFVGRRRELAELRDLEARTRLLTLTGTGGAGKTRLAKELALEVADDMTGGAWLVELAPVSDPRLVARTVATVLDVEEQQGRPLIDTLAERCGESPMLLLFDNCEHLLTACAELAEALLGRCPGLRLVATSREPLNIGGEVTWRAPSLAADEGIALFVDRARSRSPGFELTDQNADAVARICRTLEGIPLAIELAAARIAMLTPGEIARRLDTDLALLAGGSRTASRRQQTLEATIDWSYELLSDDERTLLRRLAVFAGQFSLEAAESVCASADLPRASILEHLSQLVAKSLVQRIGDRYACLNTIRTYARAKLVDAGEVDAVSSRHASHCLELASSRRPGALATWLERVDIDYDDLRVALGWCAASEPETGARLAAALYEFWLIRGYVLEARASLDQVAARLPTGSVLRSRALLDAGVFAYTAGAPDVALVRIREGLTIARTAGDADLVARGRIDEGGVMLAGGALEPATYALEEALVIARRTGNGRQEAEALHHLGVLASLRGDLAVARSRFGESLDLRRRLGVRDESGTTLALLAVAMIQSGDLVAARAAILEALRVAQALRDRRAAWSLDVLACLAALEGNAERALRLGGAAEATFESTAVRPAAPWRRFTEPLMERARQLLGREAADPAWESGRGLTFEEALSYAIAGEAGPANSS
ncbi:MAG TPA: LuxR family transcriptional regulator [Candidatus Limnocylindria bacterium]|nr:LuxR family transcriptional regulator [Candidatus Limnocylindria bacterium]